MAVSGAAEERGKKKNKTEGEDARKRQKILLKF
jgi:hypothetical protein